MADAPDSKSGGGNIVWVQVPLPALQTIDFTVFYNIGNHKVIKKVIKHILLKQERRSCTSATKDKSTISRFIFLSKNIYKLFQL